MQLHGDRIRFGIHSGQQNTTYEDYRGLWLRAEELGYDWVSCFDHYIPIFSNPEGPCFDGLTTLSALAAQTQRVACGILVCSVTYRNPAILATIASTIDHVSNGRLELGIGAGWFELEHEEYGIPFPPVGRRIRMLGEEARILKSLWTQARTTYEGQYFTITDALSEPKPVQTPHIPLWVGGTGEQLTLRVVAESADGWNTFLMPIDDYRRKLDALAEHCRDVGRDPADIRKSLGARLTIRSTESEADHYLQSLPENARQGVIAGTPDQCTEALVPFKGLGVGDFLLLPRAPYDWETIELFVREVGPRLRA